jgi:Uma2 family endonuclease
MTAEELIRLPRGQWRYELVKGELRRMTPAGHLHGKVAADVLSRLAVFVREHGLGVTYAAETGFLLRRAPDTVRAPDASFVAAARLASMQLSPEGYFPGAPDLAVEVISPSDSYSEVEEKVAEWLEAGCLVVVVLDPRRKAGRVQRPATPVVSLTETDYLSINDLLPGWSLSLEEVFR